MLNLSNMLRVPMYEFEVTMEKCAGISAYQNSRRRVAYVQAPNERDAMREAKKQFPQFHPVSARRK